MKFAFAPLLQIQRDLYRLPRGMERFRAYLQTMVDPETKDIQLPLSPMNPMGKDHVPALLDEYLAFDADGLAAPPWPKPNLVSRTHPVNSKWRWSSPMT